MTDPVDFPDHPFRDEPGRMLEYRNPRPRSTVIVQAENGKLMVRKVDYEPEDEPEFTGSIDETADWLVNNGHQTNYRDSSLLDFPEDSGFVNDHVSGDLYHAVKRKISELPAADNVTTIKNT